MSGRANRISEKRFKRQENWYNISKVINNKEKFHSGVLNFTYDIFDINNCFTKEELLEHKNVTSAIFLLDQKITAMEFI